MNKFILLRLQFQFLSIKNFFVVISEVDMALAQGVYLYLGYSKKDEQLLKKVTGQGALEAIGAIQGLVSYHNVNSNKVS